MTRARRFVGGLALALSLAACATAGTVVYRERTPIYSIYLLSYAAKDGALPLVVHGNPFTVPAAQAHRELAGSLRVPNLGGTSFRLTDAPAGRKLIRLVLILSASDAGVSAATACGKLGRIVGPGGGSDILIHAALCSGGRMISRAFGTAPSAASPSDPGFTAALSAVLDAALPTACLLETETGSAAGESRLNQPA